VRVKRRVLNSSLYLAKENFEINYEIVLEFKLNLRDYNITEKVFYG